MSRIGLFAAAAAAWMSLALPAPAQQEPAPAIPEGEAAPEPKKRPRPRPRPKEAKPATPPTTPAEGMAHDMPMRGSLPEPADVARPQSPAVPAATPFAGPPVACEPGEAVRYESAQGGANGGANGGAKGMELWVTRSGTITIDNPLRPLTPDVTRVLQVVIGAKVATAYGSDLASLRRGASPVVLEGTIGGTIRWDAALAALPDTLPILAETGEPLTELRFRACGPAPAAKTLPPPKARRMAPPPPAEPQTASAGASKPEAKPARREGPPALPKPPAAPLPQGAIP